MMRDEEATLAREVTRDATAIRCQTQQGSAGQLATAQAVEQWLAQHAIAGEIWLLAHGDAGVVWGRRQAAQREDSGWLTSVGRFDGTGSGSLHPRTLQQCRLFGRASELRLWRGAQQWLWQRRYDYAPDAPYPADATELEALDETYVLWGTAVEAQDDVFSLLADGVQGLRHAVPRIDIRFRRDLPQDRPLRLHVRHYLARATHNGTVYIAASRLLDLT